MQGCGEGGSQTTNETAISNDRLKEKEMKKQEYKAIDVIQGSIQSRFELHTGMVRRKDAGKGSQTAEETCIFKRRNENDGDEKFKNQCEKRNEHLRFI